MMLMCRLANLVDIIYYQYKKHFRAPIQGPTNILEVGAPSDKWVIVRQSMIGGDGEIEDRTVDHPTHLHQFTHFSPSLSLSLLHTHIL